MTAPRYDIAAVEAAFLAETGHEPARLSFVSALGRRLGINARMIYRWRRDGMCTATADRMAIAFGVHPVELWLSWFDDALDEPLCWCGRRTSEDRRLCSEECRTARKAERDALNARMRRWLARLDRNRPEVVTDDEAAA